MFNLCSASITRSVSLCPDMMYQDVVESKFPDHELDEISSSNGPVRRDVKGSVRPLISRDASAASCGTVLLPFSPSSSCPKHPPKQSLQPRHLGYGIPDKPSSFLYASFQGVFRTLTTDIFGRIQYAFQLYFILRAFSHVCYKEWTMMTNPRLGSP